MLVAKDLLNIVAPFAGAWIEIDAANEHSAPAAVAPFAGAWIEMLGKAIEQAQKKSRSLRGSVD